MRNAAGNPLSHILATPLGKLGKGGNACNAGKLGKGGNAGNLGKGGNIGNLSKGPGGNAGNAGSLRSEFHMLSKKTGGEMQLPALLNVWWEPRESYTCLLWSIYFSLWLW